MTWSSVVWPVLYVVGLWWVSTGTILALYTLSRRTMRLSYVVSTLIGVFAMGGLVATRDSAAKLDIYLAVTCGVAVFGWQVTSYYLGFITGPTQPTPRQISQERVWERFAAVLKFSLYHEVMAIAVGILIAMLTLPYANAWGFWIYLALWAMHASARLNVFFGVRNFRIDLLPSHMQPLGDLLGKQNNNVLFPVSAILSSCAIFALLYQAALTPAQAEGYLLVAIMIALGLFEHFLMILPLPAYVWGFALHHVALPVERSVKEPAVKGQI